MRTKAIRKTGRRLRILLLLPVVCAPAITGCMDDAGEYITPNEPTSSDITITVTIPGAQLPTTRSIAGDEGEAQVNTLDVLVFKEGAAGAAATLLEKVQGTIITQDNTQGKHQVKFKALLTPNSLATSLVILANARDAVGNIGTSMEKNKILEALANVSINSGGGSDGWKWKTTPSNYTPIPMYGEADLPATGVTEGMNITGVNLIRMLARIDVVNNAGADFMLNEVYVVNYNTAGYIAPAWKIATGELLPELPESPMIPADKNTPQTTFAKAMKYAFVPDGAVGMVGEIYAYEANATTGGEGVGHTQAVCLILKGTYKGTEGYYRVDFTEGKDTSGRPPTDEGFDPSKVEYMPLYRNYLYQFTISTVIGPGYANGETAVRSLGITNNLKTNLLVINQNEIANIVFDGQYYLGVEVDVVLGRDAGMTKNILCITNYVDGWQMDESRYPGGIEFIGAATGWLEASKLPIEGTGKNAYLKVNTKQSNSGSAIREAILHIKAGLLKNSVKVTQNN